MDNHYAKTHYASRHDYADKHDASAYALSMAQDTAHVLAELIRITGISQARLAEIAEVSQPTVSKWFTGVNQPSKPSWEKVMLFAASREDTVHLVHQYLFGLFGDNDKFLGSFFSAAFKRNAS